MSRDLHTRDEIRRLYDRHGRMLLAYACALLRDVAAAEDVVHHVFTRLLRGDLAIRGEPSPYLCRAVRNAAFNRRRGRDREVALEPNARWLEAPPGLDEMALAIQDAVAALPAEQREVVVLHVWGGMTFQEITVVIFTQRGAAQRVAFAQMQNPPAGDLAAELAQVEAGDLPFDKSRHGAVLDANTAAIGTMLRASRLVSCDWGIDTELGPYAPVAHVARGRALARLNTMAGIRHAAAGEVEIALEHWMGNLRFSQHLASGGSLLATHAASTALRSALGAIERTAVSGAFAATSTVTLSEALRGLPETGFAWDDAWRAELAAVEGWAVQLAADPQAFERVTGRSAASRPGATDIAAYRRFMTRAAAALALPPDAAQSVLADLERERAGPHEFLDGLIPSLLRVNETRTRLKADRDRVLRLIDG